MEDEEKGFATLVGIKNEDDALAEAAECADLFAFDRGYGRDGGAQQKWAGDAEVLERLADDAWRERGEVGEDVGELGHRFILTLSVSQ
jgi:hypothetical protein